MHAKRKQGSLRFVSVVEKTVTKSESRRRGEPQNTAKIDRKASQRHTCSVDSINACLLVWPSPSELPTYHRRRIHVNSSCRFDAIFLQPRRERVPAVALGGSTAFGPRIGGYVHKINVLHSTAGNIVS